MDVRRLMALGMATELAKELAKQVEAEVAGGGVEAQGMGVMSFPGENDLEALAGENVDVIEEALPGLTDDELNELLAIEQNGKNRSTLIEAIEREQDRRANEQA